MKQKIVIKVSMNGKNSFLDRLLNCWQQKMMINVFMNGLNRNQRPKAMNIAVSLPGVESVAFQGEEKDQLVVIGDGIDSVVLTALLRKRMGYAELVSVGPPEEKKEEKEEKKEQVMLPISMPVIYQGVPTYHTAYEALSYHREPLCTIM